MVDAVGGGVGVAKVWIGGSFWISGGLCDGVVAEVMVGSLD